MITRKLLRLPLGSSETGTSLAQMYFAVRLQVLPVRHLVPRVTLIKTKKENLLLSKRASPMCAGNSLARHTVSTQRRHFVGRYANCWGNGTFAELTYPRTTAEIAVGGIRRYSSFEETVRENIAPSYVGYFKLVYDSPPVEFVQNALLSFHSYTGLPWWATLVLGTLIIRVTITLPLSMYQHYVKAKLQNLSYDMEAISYRIRKETDNGVNHSHWSHAYAKRYYARAMKREWNKLVVKENCHPMKNVLIPIIQIPMYACVTIATMNMCYMLPEQTEFTYSTFRELTTGGFGWISNLVVPDPYFLLPVISAVTALSFIEIRYMVYRDRNRFQKYSTYFARTIVLIIVPLTSLLPSGVYLLWLTNNVYTLFETLLMLSPRVRRFARIPETDTDLEHPYATMREMLKDRFKLKKSMSTPSKL